MSAAEIVEPQGAVPTELRVVPASPDAQKESDDPRRRLGQLVTTLIDEHDNTKPEVIVDLVVAEVLDWTREDQAEVLKALLHTLVWSRVRDRRHDAMGRVGKTGRSRSAKAAESVLMIVLTINGTRKRLGDCTMADLDAVIADHEDAIAEHTHRRNQYSALRTAMRRHKARVVADLDPAVIDKAVQR